MSLSFEPRTLDWSISGHPRNLRMTGDIDPKDLEYPLLYYKYERAPVNNDPRDGWNIMDTPFDPYAGADGNLFYRKLMVRAAYDHSAQMEIYEREVRRAKEMDKHWEKYFAPMPGYPGNDPILPPHTMTGNAYGYSHNM